MGRPTDEPVQRELRDPGPAETETDDAVDPADAAPEPPEPAPLLELRDGLPPVVDTAEAYARVVEAFARGTGPVAIDAERASGYRYSARAYLVQLRREGAGTALVDPIAFADLSALHDALGDAEWILHAATQDLSCLAEVGLRPTTLFDTELAGRLLGYPRVGLATLARWEPPWACRCWPTTRSPHLPHGSAATPWPSCCPAATSSPCICRSPQRPTT